MAIARARTSGRKHATAALVVKKVAYGDADVIVHLFTETIGAVSAIAHRAKKSGKLALEPLHTLFVVVEERGTSDLMTLRESRIEVPRVALLSSLDAMELAAGALTLIRTICPPHVAEPELWARLVAFLDAPSRTSLSELALFAITVVGFGLELFACVTCGTPCPEGRAAMVAPMAGGVVCRACGGGPLLLSGPTRERMARASAGEEGMLDARDVPRVVELVSQVLAAHGGVVDSRRWATMSLR